MAVFFKKKLYFHRSCFKFGCKNTNKYLNDKILFRIKKFYSIGTDGELFPMKRKGRYFEINRRDIDEILL
jgi:hypothetical protein